LLPRITQQLNTGTDRRDSTTGDVCGICFFADAQSLTAFRDTGTNWTLGARSV